MLKIDEVIVNVIINKSHNLTLCEQLSYGYDCILSVVTFKLLLWKFSRNFINIELSTLITIGVLKRYVIGRGLTPTTAFYVDLSMPLV
jgi:hypothetical protein